MTRTALLDKEAVQALCDPRHRKHRSALRAVEATAERNRRGAGSVLLTVPTAVRVEAGWDRRSPSSAAVNRLKIADAALDRDAADRAVRIRVRLGVSVADAHLGAVLAAADDPVTVVTSDPDDVRLIANELGRSITIIRL